MGEDKNVWDRAWTVEEMRGGANNWSLASDAGMLQHLQEFSQRMIARTHEIQQQVNGLVHETKLSSIRVNSAFNNFIMLANTQFVENRVYDEDVTQGQKDGEKNEEKEKTKEEREAELIPKITQAVRLGLNVIDTAFEKLDMNEGDSESEDEQQYNAEPLLEPKDPYIHRALPYIIGSQAFMQDDDVGLIDMPSDEEEEPALESESESEQSESDSESESEKVPQPRKTLAKFDSESDSDDGDLFGEKKKFSDDEELVASDRDSEQSSDSEQDTEPPQNVPDVPKDFSSELASKLGLPAATPTVPKQTEQTKEPGVKKKSEKERKKKDKPHKAEHAKGVDDDDDLFSAAPRDDMFADDDDGSPFGSGGGLFSTGKKVTSLFDDEDEQGDLFADAPAPSKSKQPISEAKPEAKPVKTKASPAPSPKQTKSGKKVPAGGVSIFGDDGDDLFSAPQTSQTKKPAAALFDEEEDDLFDTVKPTKQTHVTQSRGTKSAKVSALFDEGSSDSGSDEQDLFADKGPQNALQDSKVEKPVAKSPDQPKKKLPAGAVSVFGNAPNPLLEAMKAKQKQPETESEEDSDWSETERKSTGPTAPAVHSQSDAVKHTAAAKPNQLPRKQPGQTDSMNNLLADESDGNTVASSASNKGLFDDEDNDLFSVVPQKPKPAAKRETVQKSTGVVKQPPKDSAASKVLTAQQSDSDDDLFQAVSKPASQKEDKRSSRSNTLLFEDEQEEDLFASQPSSTVSTKKKPAGGVALFGGADLFGSKPSNIPDKTEQSRGVAKVEGKPEQATQNVQKKTISLFDAESEDEDLFSVIPAKSQTEKSHTAPAKSAGLFDDTDDLFSAQSADAPEVDLFAPTSPLKTQAAKKAKPKQDSPGIEQEKTPVTSHVVSIDGATSTASTTDQEDLFHEEKTALPVTKKKPPAGAVSMFGGLDPAALIKKKTAPEETEQAPAQKSASNADPLFGSVEEKEDIFSSKISKSPAVSPKVAPKPKIQPAKDLLFDAEDKEDLFSASATASKAPSDDVTTDHGNVSSIKSKLTFNPATMLPGATPPVKEPEVRAVSFDEPVSTKTLKSVAKDRAKIQRSRRPPSRKGRLSAVQQSTVEPSAISHPDEYAASHTSRTDVNAPSHTSRTDEHAPSHTSRTDEHAPSRTDVAPALEESSLPKQRKVDLFGNDHLFEGEAEPSAQSQRPAVSKETTNAASSNEARKEKDVLFDDDDDIFSTPKEFTSKTSQQESASTLTAGQQSIAAQVRTKDTTDKVTSWLEKNEPQTKPSSKSVFEEDDDDIFASSAKPQQPISEKAKETSAKSQIPPPLKVSSVEGNVDSADENIFADAKSGAEGDLFTRPKASSFEDKDQSKNEQDDDLFSVSKTTASKSKTAFLDEDDDIFSSSSILSKPKPPPMQKTDEIFGTSTEPVSVVPKPTQHSTKATQETVHSNDSEDIFGFAPAKPASKREADDIFAESGVKSVRQSDTKPKKSNIIDDIFEDTPKAEKQTPAAVTKATDDDIFADVRPKSKQLSKKATPVADEEDIFADVPKAKAKSAKKAKKAVVKDEDIFQDDTDIFADIPAAKPKEKKSKKKAASTKPMFTNNDIDDIFATASTSKPKAQKQKKTDSAKAGASEQSAPDIFDDPLNALQ